MTNHSRRSPSRRRNLLLSKLEDRILFDASMDAGLDPSASDISSLSSASEPLHAFEQDVAPDSSDTSQQASVEQTTNELVIVDTSVDNYQQLVDDLLNNTDEDRNIQVVLLDADVNGIDQVTDILAQHSDLDALHLVTHGDDAAFRLGNAWVTAENLDAFAGQIAGWGDAMTGSGDILLYGCDLAGSAAGRQLVDSLAALTNTDVAASDNDTGSADRGGDWNLEYQSGILDTAVVFSQQLQDEYRGVLAVGPDLQFQNAAQDVQIGEDFQFTVTFDNTGTDTGYGPFIDLLFPVNGTDGTAGTETADGIDFNGATYLGQALNAIELSFPDDGGGTGTIDHPFALDAAGDPLQVTGTAGDKLVVVELPFGSYTNGQPPADIVISATTSNLADLSAPLTIHARSGFRYGSDPLDNPSSDPSVLSDNATDGSTWTESISVTPTLMELRKIYLGNEDEIATGPNHAQQYRIEVDIADGQTISNLDIIDSLPDNVVVTSIDSVLVNGVAAAYSDNLSSLSFPGNNLDLIITPTNDVTGTTADTDVAVVFSFYVTEFDADGDRVIPISGEDDTTFNPDSRSFNNARAVGDWNPIDARDAGGSDNAVADPDAAGPEHILDDKVIAIQKSVAIVNNVGVGGASPGDTLEYTLNFQISDYFTFGDLVIDDVFQDGQLFDFTYGATFTVTDINGTVTGNFTVRSVTDSNGGQTLVVDELDIDRTDDAGEVGSGPSDGSDGTTTLRFDLSQAMIDNGALDGILQGGYTDGPANLGGTTGTITFRTVIQDEYADTFVSGDRSVDQGDLITNENLSITGTVRENAEDGSINNVLQSETDNSSASINIETGTLIKDVYAINGNTTLPTGPSGRTSLTPGDVITYRIQYTVPTSDFENLTITDFLPLPIFDAADHNADGVINAADNWTFNLGGSFDGTAPASGVIEFGSNDTFYNLNAPNSNIVPAISVGSSNELQLTFGNHDDTASRSSVIELYFSITAQNEPTADGLFLTNIVRVSEGTTQNTPTVLDEIIQIEVLQPELNITKGIVSSDSASVAFDSAIGPAGISFAAAGSTGALFSGGVINSDALAAQRINANITGGIDAGDTLRYAVVLENTGSSTRGAYDVTISDSLPAGFSLVAGSVRVVDGTGTSITYSGAEANLFTTGIVLDDPGATADSGDGTNAGSVDGFDATDGQNVVIVFYDVTADASVEADETYVNTATIENFAGQEGGENHAANRPSDDAFARIESVEVTKSIVSTSEAHTTAIDGIERVTIGEIVRYQVQVALPEGSLTGLQIHDVLPQGLTFIDDGSATVSFISDGVGITSSTLTAGTLPDDAISRSTSGDNDNYDSGRDVFFKLGDIDNNDRDTNIEYVVVEFNVLVDNNNASSGARNDAGESRFNDVRIRTNGSQIYDMPDTNRPQVIIAEPRVDNIDKTGSITSGDAGDLITYTVSFDVASGNNQSDAFNVRLRDTLPSDMTLGSISSVTIDGVGATFTNNTAGNTIDILLDRVNRGQSVEVVYTATIDITVSPEDVLANTANVTWSSLPGDFGTADGTGGNSTGSDLASLNGVDTRSTPGVGTDGLVYDTLSGSLHGERDGSDGSGVNPNDYAVSDSHNVTIDGVTTFTKTLVSTEFDDAFNGANDAVIGEIVTYRLEVTFPEGTTPNAVILDTLDSGLAFVGQTNSSLNDVSITGSLTPTVGANGRSITWDFGTVTDANLANNTDGSIVLEYEVVVLNVSGNQEGTSLDNRARFRWNNDASTDLVRDAADVVVREAQVDVAKSVVVNGSGTSGDAGDSVEYTIVIQNTGDYDAFDVTFGDTLPTVSGGTSAILGATFSAVDSAGVLTAADFTLSGDDATGYSLSLNAGVDLDLLKSDGARTITLTINGTIAATNGPNDVINNTANAQWTSLDGNVASRSTFTTDDSGERDGTNPADDTRDYDDAGSANLSINPPIFTKVLFGTDQTETSGSDVTIGERVTYALTVTLPEGTTEGMNVVDLLPDGLNYESFQLVTTVAGSGGLLTADFNGTITGGGPTVSGGVADGDDVTFTFGQIDVSIDNVTTNNSFVILITAAVSDVASNVGYNPGQTTLTNTATIDIIGDSVVTPQASNSVDVDVIESNLVIDKSIIEPLADAGDTVTIELTIENTGLGDAYDVRLEDTINSAHYDLNSVVVGVSGTAYPADFTVNYNSATGLLSYAGGTIGAGDSVLFTITLDLLETVAVDSTLVNTATITNASTLQGTTPGERDDPDPDNDGSDTDNDSIRIRSNSLAGNVYFDADNDGVFDVGETGIANVDVRLRGLDHLGNAVDVTVQTLPDGSYLFDDLRPGTYRITETQPTTAINGKDYLDGADTIGTQGGNSSVNDDFTNILLPTGAETNGTGNNFGELEEVELSGFVWHDANNDGVRDASEVGIGGVEVSLSGTDDVGAIAPVTVTTNPDGSYTFEGLRPGEYTISETQPTSTAPSGRDYADGQDSDGSLANGTSTNDTTSSINAAAGDTGTEYNFGEVIESVISGYVYHDSDNDGSRGGETGIEFVDITLTGLDDLGNVINLSTQTDGSGYYEFAGLRPAGAGGYTLTQAQPVGFIDGNDSIGTPGGSATVSDVFSSINLVSDTNGTENNFGELLASSLSGTVFQDFDDDGVQQVGEPGIGGVQIRLTGTDDRGSSVDVSVLTNPDGTYSIAGLRPSDATGYTLTETQPLNYNDGIDSDGSLANGDLTTNDVNSGINIVSGDNGTGYDFSEVGASISGTVYVDQDRSGGLDPGENDRISGVLIELYDSTGTTLIDSMSTDANGNYQFDDLPADNYVIREIHPAEYSSTTPDVRNVTLPTTGLTDQNFGENLWDLGDRVWFDTDGDGVQDAGEPGLENVGVTLTYAGLDGDFSTTADNIIYNTSTDASGAYGFEDLFNGVYRVTIASLDLPSGIVGTAEVDDSAAAIDGTSNVTVGGSDRFDVDFGYTGTGSIGDTVFWDQNNDGSQAADEIGFEGILVELDIDLDGDGIAEVTLSTTTNANGEYLFERVPAGNHVVRVTQPTGTTQTFDSDGVGSSNQSTVGLTPGEDNDVQDFGYRGTGSIGDTVFFDMNGDGGPFGATGDFGLEGVRVTLEIDVDGDGTVDFTQTQTTNAAGEYLFENLIAGDYRVSLEPTDLPAGLSNFATVDRDAALDHETDVTLADAQNVSNVDFGYFATPEYSIIKTDDLAGAPATPGTTFSYFLFVTNHGEMDGTGVVVTDDLPINVLDGFSVVTDDAANVNYDPLTGRLIWNAGDLSGLGGNRTLQVTVTVQDPVSVLLTTFDNTATVTDDGNHGVDLIPENNSSTAVVPLTAVPDYEIEKTSSLTETAVVGDSFFYTIRVSNVGDQDGTGVVVTDQIPVSVLDRFNVTTDDAANVTYDSSTGELVWNVGDLAGRGDTRTLTVFVEIPFAVEDPLANVIINTATVADDGANGPEERLDNNSSTVQDDVLVFAFDSFNNFSVPFPPLDNPVYGWEYGESARHHRPLPVDPIFSGLAEPGTTLSLKIYDEEGNIIGERQVVADSGGNWLASFPNTVIWKHPHRMDVEQTAPIQTDVHELDGFNMRRYFHPALHSSLFFSERDTVSSVMRNSAYETIDSMHEANNSPLQVGWRSHLYQLNVSSTNASAD